MGTSLDSVSQLLVGRSSFWDGFGRALDIMGAGTDFNECLDGPLADELAMRSDWEAVARDIKAAMQIFDSGFKTGNGASGRGQKTLQK